jgi:PIN domain nuclease of toxin-antitoxin system
MRLDSPRLPERFREVIADAANLKYVPSVSAAEIAVMRAVGRLGVNGEISGDIADLGLDEFDFTHRHARTLDALPLHHRDPFDRMLIAQATTEDLVFLTVNSQCAAYDVRRLD